MPRPAPPAPLASRAHRRYLHGVQTIPLTRDLVLVGGGHAHALVLRRWGMDPLPGARLTLIDPGPVTTYTGMLPGHVAGHYAAEALEIDLVRLARHAGARLVMSPATGIDVAARRVEIEGRPPIAFDVLSLDVGITSAMPDLPGFSAHAVPAKPLGPFAARWRAFREAPTGDVAVIGGGVGGCELAMAMAFALRGRAAVRVIEADAALAGVGGPAARRLRAAMARLGVELVEGTGAAEVRAEAVILTDGRAIPAAFTVGVAGARAWPWVAASGLPATDGFLDVGPDLSSPADRQIFAAGDCARLTHDPRPKAGAYAVRAAPVLFQNLRAALGDGKRREYWPQKDYLKLVSMGAKRATADRSGVPLGSGALLWRLKDRIDRRFMERLTDLLPMPAPAIPRHAAAGVREAMVAAPLCGGCGAKVGGGTLACALQALPPPGRADVESLPGDDAATLRIGGRAQVLTTDHLRAFTEDPWLLARVAAIHAMGDVWAMGAAPQAALASLVLPRLSEPMQAETLREMLAAAAEAFAAEGAAIVGGHTTMGAEMSAGFAVTGLAERPIALAGARPGDALILTEPIGTGTILAAEMRGAAHGRDVAACLAMMLRPQGEAARLLAGARAMTDVTGFGLAGHLAALCAASSVGARLDLAAIPRLPGAEGLAGAGIASALAPANRAAALGALVAPQGPRTDLLFDPQTAGGLLAAVPAAEAPALLRRLRDLGHEAALIGEVTDGEGRIEAR